jgi:aquaporin PIP
MARKRQHIDCGTGGGGYQGNRCPPSRAKKRCGKKKTNKKCAVGVDNPQNWAFWKAGIVEFLATYFLIFVIGMSSSIWIGIDSWAVLVGTAIAFGFAFAITVAFAAPISGAYIHPALTLVGVFMGNVGFLRALFYILVQLLASIVAYAHLMWILAPLAFASSLPVLATGVSTAAGLATEGIATVFFTLFMLHISSGYGSMVLGTKCGLKTYASYNWLAGLALAAAAMFTVLITGASINPWRHLAAAIFIGFASDFWIYQVTGWIGVFVGYLIYLLFTAPKGQSLF